jgi:large subunit ribosomal protein L31
MSKTEKAAKSATATKTPKAPAAGIHPNQHIINVIMTDGSKFDIQTTWGKEGESLRLDLDPKNHPAWQDKAQNFINANDERVTKFNKKFGNFDFTAKKTEAA